jgi:hypothetical protein
VKVLFEAAMALLCLVLTTFFFHSLQLALFGLLSFFSARGGGEGGTLYITIIAFIFACLGLRVRRPWRWFALLVTAFAIVVALAGNTPFGWLTYRLPVLLGAVILAAFLVPGQVLLGAASRRSCKSASDYGDVSSGD